MAYFLPARFLCIAEGSMRLLAMRTVRQRSRVPAGYVRCDCCCDCSMWSVCEVPVSRQDEITIDSMAWCSDSPPSLEGSQESPGRQENGPNGSFIPTSTRWAAVLLSVPLLLIAAAAAVSGLLLRSHVSSWLDLAAFVTSAFFFLSGVVVPLGVIREKNLEREARKH